MRRPDAPAQQVEAQPAALVLILRLVGEARRAEDLAGADVLAAALGRLELRIFDRASVRKGPDADWVRCRDKAG